MWNVSELRGSYCWKKWALWILGVKFHWAEEACYAHFEVPEASPTIIPLPWGAMHWIHKIVPGYIGCSLKWVGCWRKKKDIVNFGGQVLSLGLSWVGISGQEFKGGAMAGAGECGLRRPQSKPCNLEVIALQLPKFANIWYWNIPVSQNRNFNIDGNDFEPHHSYIYSILEWCSGCSP